ncbi:MAG: DUF1573 domain-containing protein [Bacteroidia bacterium]
MSKLIIPFMLIGALFFASFNMLKPSIKFDKIEHDFGKIPQSEPVSCEFTFTNDGDAPLILTNVKASCGCTTPDWPQEPIMPGAQGVIKATYNAAAAGVFDKTITVFSNSSKPELILKLRGVVEKRTVDDGNGGKTELKLN